MFMRVMKVAGALVKPKGMTVNTNCPREVLNAVICSCPSAILLCWYPDRRSILEKTRLLAVGQRVPQYGERGKKKTDGTFLIV